MTPIEPWEGVWEEKKKAKEKEEGKEDQQGVGERPAVDHHRHGKDMSRNITRTELGRRGGRVLEADHLAIAYD